MAAHRYWLLLAVAALLVAAPVVRCSTEDLAEDGSSEPEIVSEPPAAKPAAPAAAHGSLDQYKELALEYTQKAIEVGKEYAAQAQELAVKYLSQAQELAAPYLEKAGIKTSKKTEL